MAQHSPAARQARFHLCLRQGAGRLFSWLEVGFVKAALSRPVGLSSRVETHQSLHGIPKRVLRNSQPLGGIISNTDAIRGEIRVPDYLY